MPESSSNSRHTVPTLSWQQGSKLLEQRTILVPCVFAFYASLLVARGYTC